MIGIDGVAIGFDFFEFIYRREPKTGTRNCSKSFQLALHPRSEESLTCPKSDAELIERGFKDKEIEKILRGNWMRIFAQIL